MVISELIDGKRKRYWYWSFINDWRHLGESETWQPYFTFAPFRFTIGPQTLDITFLGIGFTVTTGMYMPKP